MAKPSILTHRHDVLNRSTIHAFSASLADARILQTMSKLLDEFKVLWRRGWLILQQTTISSKSCSTSNHQSSLSIDQIEIGICLDQSIPHRCIFLQLHDVFHTFIQFSINRSLCTFLVCKIIMYITKLSRRRDEQWHSLEAALLQPSTTWKVIIAKHYAWNREWYGRWSLSITYRKMKISSGFAKSLLFKKKIRFSFWIYVYYYVIYIYLFLYVI